MNIEELIKSAMKAQDKERVNTLRLIKTEFMKWETATDNVGKSLDDATKISIMQKMVKQRNDSVNQYMEGNRQDLADAELAEIAIIKEFLPKEITEEEIRTECNALIEGGLEPIKKNMGVFMKSIKAKYPSADGKLVSTIVSSILN